MRLLIVVLFALLAAILVPLIAHSEGLSWSSTRDARWHDGGLRTALARGGGEVLPHGTPPSPSIRRSYS